MRARHQALTAIAALAVLAGVAMPSFSAATFTSSSASTGTVRAASDWTPPTVELRPPAGSDPFGDEGHLLTGTVELHASATDGESAIATLAIQARGAGSGPWTEVCAVTGPATTCVWDTTRVADGPYEVRAHATDGAGYLSTSTVLPATVRNHVAVQLTPLPAYVRGPVSLKAVVGGAGGSTYPVEIQHRAAGAGTWLTACSGTACSWPTSGLATGSYELRARVVAGGSVVGTSALVTTVVDNSAPQVVMTDPGTPLTGTVTVAATATDAHSGVAAVTLYAQRSDGPAPTSLCTLATAPYSCTYDTRQLADGTYSFWAVARDRAGHETTSPAVSTRVIRNVVAPPLWGTDVQAVNGRGTLGRIDDGDAITYDFNQMVATGSLLTGWDGTPRNVTVTVGPGGPSNHHNELTVDSVSLGGLVLEGNHLPGNNAMTFSAQMTASTHQGATRVTVVLTSSSGLSQQKTVTGPRTMVWSPSATIRTPGQGAIVPGTVTESGAADVDF